LKSAQPAGAVTSSAWMTHAFPGGLSMENLNMDRDVLADNLNDTKTV